MWYMRRRRLLVWRQAPTISSRHCEERSAEADQRSLMPECHRAERLQQMLVEDRDRDKGLADIVQQGSTGETALVVLAHAEMLREGYRKSGDEQAMAIGVGMMAADRRQPFTQRRMPDGLENLVFGFHDIAEL